MQGRWELVFLFLLVLFFNVVGEELWWRGVILPRQELADRYGGFFAIRNASHQQTLAAASAQPKRGLDDVRYDRDGIGSRQQAGRNGLFRYP